jgi:hypothetical protein
MTNIGQKGSKCKQFKYWWFWFDNNQDGGNHADESLLYLKERGGHDGCGAQYQGLHQKTHKNGQIALAGPQLL